MYFFRGWRLSAAEHTASQIAQVRPGSVAEGASGTRK
jgi:hypothetical protein